MGHRGTPAPVSRGRLLSAALLALVAWAPSLGAEESAIAAASKDTGITLVVVGDTGLNSSMQPVEADAGLRHGVRQGWNRLTSGIKGEINGDLNFANLETVVTDRNDLATQDKTFSFRSHPAGVRHLVGIGFNLFSTANNHAADFGERGLRETLRHLDALEGAGLKAHAGVGIDREAAGRPHLAQVKGAQVRLSAIGIGAGDHRAAAGRPGQLAYGSPEDFTEVVSRLAAAEGAYRILSVHYGSEMQLMPDPEGIRRLRDRAVRDAGIDLVVGHHAHVAAGVQDIGGRLVFYGLGNFLHLGMQDMARFGICRDYGLLARLHLARSSDGRLRARAVEVVPLTGMHERTTRMPASPATTRIHVLNHLAQRLDDMGADARGVRFAPQPDGSGLRCFPGAAEEPGRIGTLCRQWAEPAQTPAPLAQQIAAACGGPQAVAARDARARLARSKAGASEAGNVFTSLFGF